MTASVSPLWDKMQAMDMEESELKLDRFSHEAVSEEIYVPDEIICAQFRARRHAGIDAVDGQAKIRLTLNVFDKGANTVDFAQVLLSAAAIADIIDHAAQAILARRLDSGSKELERVLDELEEALTTYGVLEE